MNNTIVVKSNPLSNGTPLVDDLSAMSGMDQGTVAAKLDAEIREEENRRMMNPSRYPDVENPSEVVKAAAENTRAEINHPEMNLSEEPTPTTTEQAPGAGDFSAQDMNDFDKAAEWANSMYPSNDDITGAELAENNEPNAGSVNGDSDITNQSLDFVNSIEPTPEPQGPEVDVVPDDETSVANDAAGAEPVEEDPSMVAGDSI